MENPNVGEIVLHRNGCRAEVIALGSLATVNGPAVMYNLKFLEGPYSGVNCLREEFTFPVPGNS
jgi:hypothetical protein